MNQYIPKLINKDININVNLSNYATKTDSKNINLGCFKGKSHFDEDGVQNYLVFQSMLEYFTINYSIWIAKWKSKGLSNENLEVISTSNNSLSPSVDHYRNKVRLKFRGSILQQKRIIYNHERVANTCIVYEITNFKYKIILC